MPEATTATKKDLIMRFYESGAKSISEIAALTHSRPSYVANVLRDANILGGYFDLYTSTEHPMNIYAPLFAHRLGFRTVPIARRSVRYIERLYNQFKQSYDRAGQHHALVVALTMMNRAWWGGKIEQANIFRTWLLHKISHPDNGELPLLPADAASP